MTHPAQDCSKKRDRLLTVKDVARETGVEAHVVRFYARSGLIRPARIASNGYRQFVPLDVKRVHFVRCAQSLGFTLAEVRDILLRSRQNATRCPLVRDIMSKRLRENRCHLKRVRELQRRMEAASKRWLLMPDGSPSGEAICALIEAVADGMPRGAIGSRARGASHLKVRT